MPYRHAHHEIFAALGHPIRLALVEALRDAPRTPVHALAARFDVSRPAISQHLGVLRDAGLVVERPRGRESHYELVPARFSETSRWLRQYETFWDGRRAALESHLARRRR